MGLIATPDASRHALGILGGRWALPLGTSVPLLAQVGWSRCRWRCGKLCSLTTTCGGAAPVVGDSIIFVYLCFRQCVLAEGKSKLSAMRFDQPRARRRSGSQSPHPSFLELIEEFHSYRPFTGQQCKISGLCTCL